MPYDDTTMSRKINCVSTSNRAGLLVRTADRWHLGGSTLREPVRRQRVPVEVEGLPVGERLRSGRHPRRGDGGGGRREAKRRRRQPQRERTSQVDRSRGDLMFFFKIKHSNILFRCFNIAYSRRASAAA